MCWSKHNQDNDDNLRPTPTAMTDPVEKEGCPHSSQKCNNGFCKSHGLCCEHTVSSAANERRFCICFKNYMGTYCDTQVEESRGSLARTTAIAVFSAVLGAIVIAVFVAIVVLQIKYYRNRKRRRMEQDQEMNKISKPDADKKEENGGAKRLRTQPGYSWRESVRKHSTASRKLKGPNSRSVPDDLGSIGLVLAAIGGKAPAGAKYKVLQETSDGKTGEGGGGESVVRCFSADAAVGKHEVTIATIPTSSSSRDRADGCGGREQREHSTERLVHVEVEEDTVR